QLDLADASKIARAAQDLAVVGMRDSSEAATDLLHAITSLQPRLLKKYGIYVTLTQVYKDAAKALGKNVTELTSLEKRQGFLNSILIASAGYVGSYEAAMTSAGKQLRSLPRYIQEASNAIGQYFLPMLGDAVGALTAFLKGIVALPAPVLEGAAVLLGMGTVFAGTTAAIGGMVLMIPKLSAALLFLAANPVVLVIAGVAALAVGLYALTKHMESAARANEELTRAAIETSTTYAGYLRAVEDSATGTVVLSAEVWELTKAEMALVEEADKAAVALQNIVNQELLNRLEEHQQVLRDTGGVTLDLVANIGEVVDAEMEHTKRLILQDVALRDVAVAQGLLTQAEVDAVQAIESADRAMLSYAKATQEAREALGFYAHAMDTTTWSSQEWIEVQGAVG
ncbi:hypothetical protein LCGC14_2852220, partial [marine sediment metagenome]